MADKREVQTLSAVFRSTDPEVEKRTERRLLCSNLVRIGWRDHGGDRRTETGVLENVSRGGLGLSLHVSVAMKRGTELTILANWGEFTGSVTHCTSLENGYGVGLELDKPCAWTNGRGPEHLLDPMLLDLG